MVKASGEPKDPFKVTAERCIDRVLMKKAMTGMRADELPSYDFSGKWSSELDPITLPRSIAAFNDFKERIWVAAVGGLFLIIPMWIMVLHNTLWTGLVSTTVFVAVFGLLMAWVLRENMDVLSNTAAYAAVLVVFVGLSLGS